MTKNRTSPFVFRSARPRIARPRNFSSQSPTKRRHQRVRFRGRYARSLVHRIATSAWIFSQVALVLGFLAAGAGLSLRFWRNSQLFKISTVRFEGDVPKGLMEALAIQSGQNIFAVHPRDLERRALAKFPQLKTISVTRTPWRDVVVSARYRLPVAWIETNRSAPGSLCGVDHDGRLFPVNTATADQLNRPTLRGTRDPGQLKMVTATLTELEKSRGDFYSLIRQIETDTIQSARITLRDGEIILWGELEPTSAVKKALSVERIRREFSPLRQPASMRFVTDNRIILDANWARTSIDSK